MCTVKFSQSLTGANREVACTRVLARFEIDSFSEVFRDSKSFIDLRLQSGSQLSRLARGLHAATRAILVAD
jgi:hypothetical protein